MKNVFVIENLATGTITETPTGLEGEDAEDYALRLAARLDPQGIEFAGRVGTVAGECFLVQTKSFWQILTNFFPPRDTLQAFLERQTRVDAGVSGYGKKSRKKGIS